MEKYWESESPMTITTGSNVLQYYPVAEKLSVSRPGWTDADGNERLGKTVALNIEALLESGVATMEAAREVFANIIASIDARLELLGKEG